MSYIDTWKSAKKSFETTTGRKKPSEKFLGFFNKSSGMEKACKGLDTAWKKGKEKEMLKAAAEYHKAMHDYLQQLEKARGGDKEGGDYKTEVIKLGEALEEIAMGFTSSLQERKRKLFAALEKSAKGLAVEVDKSYEQCQTQLETAKHESEQADVLLRQILKLVGNKDVANAQKLYVKMQDHLKVIGQVNVQAGKIATAAEKTYHGTLDKWDLSLFETGTSPTEYWRNEADTRLMAIRDLVSSINDVQQTTKGTLTEAAGILKGGANADQAYLASAQRTFSRCEQRFATLDQMVRFVTGGIDMCGMELMNSKEARTKGQAEVADKLLEKAQTQFDVAKVQRQKGQAALAKAQQELAKAVHEIPAELRDKLSFKEVFNDFDKLKEMYDELEEELTKAGPKLEKLAGKLAS